jgi:signal peptidase II
MKTPRIMSLALFFAVLLIDQVSKHLAPSSLVYYNEGLIFGSLSELPSMIRVVTLCSFGGFILTAYLFLTRMLAPKLSALHLGMGIFVGGIFGNITDRTLSGSTIDFIPLTIGNFSIIFNLADLFQWVGAILITIQLIRKENILWFPKNQRGKFLVLWRDQMSFATKMTATSFCSVVLLGLFAHTFMRTALIEAQYQGDVGLLIKHFFIGYVSLSSAFCLFVFILSLYLSHRMAGPLFAFELYVEELLHGGKRRFRLREGDQSKHLVKIADELHQHFNETKKAS